MPKADRSWLWMRAVVPVVTVLLCGVVWCAQLALPVRMGSRFGIAGPDDCRTLPPTADSVAVLAWEAAFWLFPGVVPEALTTAPDGPAVTLVDTPRAKPPA